MVSDKELTDYARQFLKDYFGLQLLIPITRNNRLKSTLGRYIFTQKGKPLKIELAGNLLSYGNTKTIFGVLKHECVHYAFHVQGKNMRDGDEQFEKMLKKCDAPSTHTLKVGKYFLFHCSKCGKIGETRLQRLKKTPNNYRSSCCQAKLAITGEKIYRGFEDL